jgi:membrane protease YdiL (CAAX protease family)
VSHWVPYVVLAAFPLLGFFPFNIVAFSWGFRHGTQEMPTELAVTSNRIDTYVERTKHIFLLVVVLSFAIHYAVPFAQIGLRWNDWRWNLALGVGVGILQLSLMGFVWKVTPARKGFLGDERILKSPIAEWIISNLYSVFTEELWIAFCIVTLMKVGHSSVTSLLLTAAVFGAAHYQYRLGAVATVLYGIVFGSLFVWRGSLLPSYLMHFMGNVGALYFARRGHHARIYG